MTTEFVLLLLFGVFISLGAFFGESGPAAVFGRSGPRLGARLEQHISTGRGFQDRGAGFQWQRPTAAPRGVGRDGSL